MSDKLFGNAYVLRIQEMERELHSLPAYSLKSLAGLLDQFNQELEDRQAVCQFFGLRAYGEVGNCWTMVYHRPDFSKLLESR